MHIFHKWGKWITQPYGIVQERECTVCGKRKRRVIY
jgi:hypothetical protein